MNKDVQQLSADLGRIKDNPMTTRRDAKSLHDAILLLNWFEADIRAKEFALSKLTDAQNEKILDADSGAVLGESDILPTPKKPGRSKKSAE